MSVPRRALPHTAVSSRAQPSPRVAASGLFLEHPNTGTGRYARHVLKYLADDDELTTFVIADDRSLVSHALEERKAMRIVRAPIPPLRAASYARKLCWEQVALPAAAQRLHADVLYSPHFSTPLLCSCPTVISIHDVIPLTDPAYAQSFAAKGYFCLVGLAARRSAAAITLSHYAKHEIVQRLHIHERRVHVVEPGVEEAFGAEADPAGAARARERYRLPDHYILYVGGADARKNIGVLLDAVAGLRDVASVPVLVVVAGLPKAGQETLFPDWRAESERLRLGSQVHFVERVAEEDLPAVYRGARAFVFPSRAEGFGLPPLEAMACGTPVVCSDATSLPEAVGRAGILVHPDRSRDWATAMQRVANDDALCARMSAEGLERASCFTWSVTGAKVAAIIRGAVPCAC